MLPNQLIVAARGQPMLVELKNGETYNGHLEQCDTWMNLYLKEVICTSAVCICINSIMYILNVVFF